MTPDQQAAKIKRLEDELQSARSKVADAYQLFGLVLIEGERLSAETIVLVLDYFADTDGKSEDGFCTAFSPEMYRITSTVPETQKPPRRTEAGK